MDGSGVSRSACRDLFMLIPDTTARVGAWYPDNSLIRVDLPEPFWPEQARASAGLMVGSRSMERRARERLGQAVDFESRNWAASAEASQIGGAYWLDIFHRALNCCRASVG